MFSAWTMGCIDSSITTCQPPRRAADPDPSLYRDTKGCAHWREPGAGKPSCRDIDLPSCAIRRVEQRRTGRALHGGFSNPT